MLCRRMGAAIREVRQERRWYQEQLGARAGIPPSRVGEVERGAVNTSVVRVADLARALGTTPAALFHRVELATQDGAATALQRARVAEAVRRLQPRDLDVLA